MSTAPEPIACYACTAVSRSRRPRAAARSSSIVTRATGTCYPRNRPTPRESAPGRRRSRGGTRRPQLTQSRRSLISQANRELTSPGGWWFVRSAGEWWSRLVNPPMFEAGGRVPLDDAKADGMLIACQRQDDPDRRPNPGTIVGTRLPPGWAARPGPADPGVPGEGRGWRLARVHAATRRMPIAARPRPARCIQCSRSPSTTRASSTVTPG